MDLLARVSSVRGLKRAWEEVLASDRADGELSAGVQRFAESPAERIAELHTELSEGSYRPRDLVEVVLADDDRTLHVPAVRDRLVERSILDAVVPFVDPHLGPGCYAYRPGLGVADAVQALARLRGEGLSWVLRTDVDDCFPSIPVARARRMLAVLVPDPDLLMLVDQLLARPYVRRRGGRGIVRGLPQGCALSPLLTNLVLTELDDALLDRGFAVVRYADDRAPRTLLEVAM